MSILKSCPFCGRKAELHYYEIDEPFTFTECGYEICCLHCGIRFKERLSRMPQFDKKADIKRQNLIERWNRRVSDGVGSNEVDRIPFDPLVEMDIKRMVEARLAQTDCAWKKGEE